MSVGKLPEGWTSTPVSTVTTLIRGVTYKKEQAINYLKDNYLPLIRANNIQNGKFDTTNLVFVPKNLVKESQKISPEDIVIAMSSGSKSVVGKSAHQHLPFECSFGAFCGALRPEKSILSGFVAHFTKSSFYRNKISSLSAGANINNIKPASFDLINIPIPSFAEQKIIAEKLDSLLAQVDSSKARLEKIPKILKRFRQAVLASAVSGSLTKIWREINNIPNWDVTDWESILRSKKDSFKRGPFGSSLKKSMFVSEGYKVYEQYCPINDDCSYARYFITEEKFYEMKSFEVLDGDFLISCSGVSLGRITQVPKNSEKGIINQALLRVRINNEIYLDDFFVLLFRSPIFQKKIFDNSTGSAIPNLKGVKKLKAMEVPLLCLNEQHEIVRRVEQLFAYADTIEKQVDNALSRVNNLTQSILAKAFRGELTAQWRAENPELISGENSAAALLEKIKAERAASSGKKASRKKS